MTTTPQEPIEDPDINPAGISDAPDPVAPGEPTPNEAPDSEPSENVE